MILEKFAFSFVFKLLPGTVFLHIVSTVAYQTMVAHQYFLPLPRSLILSSTKQPYSKVILFIYLGNSGMYRYGNSVSTSNFYPKLKKKIEVPLTILRRKRILNKHLCKNFFYENRIPVFCGYLNVEKGDE